MFNEKILFVRTAISKLDEADKERSTTIDVSTKQSKPVSVYSCWFCAKPGRSLHKCSVCRKARYCGETCQWEDWWRHRKRCRSRGERREEKREQKKSRDSMEDSHQEDEVD